MVTEKELIGKIGELRQIRPRKDWVVLTKSQILGEEPKVLFFPFFKPVLATATAFGILFGIFSLAQNSLPGDTLYPIKKMTEKSQAVFVSEEEKPAFQLKLANERLEDLTKIAETNQVKKIAPALEEYQASISEAAKNLAKITATTSDPVVVKKIAEQTQELTQELEEKKEKLEKTYGIAGLEFKEESNPTKVLVEWLIEDLESRTLTENQEELLEGAKEDFEVGDYNQALEKILLLSYPQE